MKKTFNYIPTLTPLRGIAATLVIFFHYHIFLAPLTPQDNYMISKLYLMVDLFFVLSGFVMLHVYGDYFRERVEGAQFWKFMKARFARIYPLHLFTFLYLLLWIVYMKTKIDFSQTPAIFQSVFDNSAIFGILTLTHAWGTHMEATWNTASWSISVEWFLYLIFPLLVWIIGRHKFWTLLVLGIAAQGLLFVLSYIIEPEWIREISIQRQLSAEQMSYRPKNTIDIITGFALLRGFCSFIFGMVAYKIYERDIGRSILKHGYWFVLIWGILFSLWSGDWLPDSFAIPIFALLIVHCAYVEGIVQKLLNSKVFTYLGNISYSIYLVHVPLILTMFIIALIKGEMPAPPGEINYANNWLGAIILLVIVVVIASITYRFIEKPARRILRKIG